MDWQTIYDVQQVNSQGVGNFGIIFAAIAFGLPGLCILLFSSSAKARPLGYFLVLQVPGMALISLTGEQRYRRLKQELAAGHTVEVVGAVDDVHWQSAGKHSIFVFTVEGAQFYLPEFYPASCRPYPGQQVDIATEPGSAGQRNNRVQVLRMRVEAGSCQAPPPTPARS